MFNIDPLIDLVREMTYNKCKHSQTIDTVRYITETSWVEQTECVICGFYLSRVFCEEVEKK